MIKLSNTETPIISCAKEIIVDAYDCYGAYVDAPEVLVEGESCTGDYMISNNSIYATYSGPDASGRYPIGKTIVEYTVEYACGKEKDCRTDIVVLDNKPAVPYCYSGLNVALMPQDTDNDGTIDDGMVEVWASDLNVGSFHPCNNGPLIFSFSSDITETSRIFTCEEVGANSVQMWVTDIHGNQSYCVVNLNVQNNAANIPNCEPDEARKYVLSGKIKDEQKAELEHVQITLKDRVPVYNYITERDSVYNYEIIDSFYKGTNALVYIYDLTIEYIDKVVDSVAYHNVMHLMSNDNGVYGTNDILLNRDYEISAYKTDDMSRISIEDLNILNAHVDGTAELSDPYALLAADINEDKQINSEDVSLLEELISGEEDEWPQERQWVFYNLEEMARMSDQPLSDDLSQMVYIQDVQNKSHHLDFMGILKGDLTKFVEEEEAENSEGLINIEIRNHNAEELSFYPNPFVSQVTVERKAGEATNLSVYNNLGERIFQTTISKHQTQLTIEESQKGESGSYIYKLENNGEVKTGKLIKI